MDWKLQIIQEEIDQYKKREGSVKELSDGYHTFGELYEFRKTYNAVLFNEWGSQLRPVPINPEVLNSDFEGQISFEVELKPKYDVHKSWKHNNGEWCFGKEKKWFIVCALLPTGLISNHYKAEDWDLFQIPEVEKAKYPFDGHTSKDVLQRLSDLNV